MKADNISSVEVSGQAGVSKPIMSEKARTCKNEYQRHWRHLNPGKVQKYSFDYWQKKAGNDVTDNVTDKTTETRLTVTKICLWCGGEFSAKRRDARYCSPLCRVNHNRKQL